MLYGRGLGRDIISTTVAMVTGYCVMGRHTESMRLPINDFCRGCRSAAEEDTVVRFFCQCPSLARCRNRLFGYSFLVSLTKAIIYWLQGYKFVYQTFWLLFQRMVVVLLMGSPYIDQLLSLPWFGQYRWSVYLWLHNGPLCVLTWALWYDQTYHSDLTYVACVNFFFYTRIVGSTV